MERKLALLEQRLNLVEQFVEIRFCESYRDFILRKSTGDVGKLGEKNENNSLKLVNQFLGTRFCESFRDFTVRQLSSLSQSYAAGGEGEDSRASILPTCNQNRPSNSESNSPPKKSRPRTRSSTATAAKRELRIRIIRLEDNQLTSSSKIPTEKDKICQNLDKSSACPALIKVGTPLSPPPPTNLDDNTQDNFEETSRGEEDGDDNGEDNYFTFPIEAAQAEVDDNGRAHSENEEDADPLGTSAVDPDDQSWSETTTDSEKSVCGKSTCSSNKKRIKRKVDFRRISDERTFKCGYPPCSKAFYEKKHLAEHERIHQKDKWVKCRMKSCGRLCRDNSKRLVHERKCILENLRKGNYVSSKVIEDVRRRSKLKEDPFKGINDFPKLEAGEVDEEEEMEAGVLRRRRKRKIDAGDGDGGRPRARSKKKEKGKGKQKRKKEQSYPFNADMVEDILIEGRKACPLCRKHFPVDALDTHLKTHVMERHLKCRFCGKGFLSTGCRYKHERGHEKEKYGLRCRVGGGGDGGDEAWCKKLFTDSQSLLTHERGCVRRALEKGREVGKEVIEDLRRRSEGVMLNWRGYDVGEEEVGRVKVCFVCKRWKGEGKEYEEHMEGHRDWGCGKCGERFLTKVSLVRHVHRRHREKEKKGEVGDEEEAVADQVLDGEEGEREKGSQESRVDGGDGSGGPEERIGNNDEDDQQSKIVNEEIVE